jgi:hypothetical protein
MAAVSVDQPVGAAQILVNDEVLAEQPERLDWMIVQLGNRADRLLVSAQQVAHPSAGSNLSQQFILAKCDHALLRS